MNLLSDRSKWLAAAAAFALCVGPTFISYQPYQFTWDDADYMERTVAVSRAFWSWNVHGIGAAMISIRPPAMTLMGLPWGPLTSWQSVGDCFITLAAAVSLLAAACLYLLLRIGVKPIFLVIASVCVFAALGPFPAGAPEHVYATGFMADNLFAWTALAAILLIPYEARVPCVSIRGAVMRGILWGCIFSLGLMTKLNFFYFIGLIAPTLFVLSLRRGGARVAGAAVIACACCSVPAAFYLHRWGRLAFWDARASSFGVFAGLNPHSFSWFFAEMIRHDAPGVLLSLALTVAALTYLVIKRRITALDPDFLALLIIIGFTVVVLSSQNRQTRYLFPVIVALPFLTAILMSRHGSLPTKKLAALIAGVVFCGLIVAALPTRQRPSRQNLSKSDAILAEAATCNARHILMAADSQTFNKNLMDLATEFWTTGTPIQVDTLAYRALFHVPIKEDFQTIDESDEVIFQKNNGGGPFYSNQGVSDYEAYVRQRGYDPVKVGDDLTVYRVHCRP